MRFKYILITFAVLLVLGGVYYFISRPLAPKSAPPTEYVWNIQDSDLTHITISLPKETPVQQESFVKISHGDAFPWFFDNANHSPVDTTRWGGGIPLILSGPGADRIITDNATSEQLALYGIDNPSMVITLTLTDKEIMKIIVGDATPNGDNHYVKSPDSNAVATVDSTWYTVLEDLVTDPPYVHSSTTTTPATASTSTPAVTTSP